MAEVGRSEARTKQAFTFLIVSEALILAAAAVAMIRFDLGWAGAIGIALIASVFGLTLLRVGEERAKAAGNLSPAMRRYHRRMLTAGAIYMVGLFTAIWVHDELHPDGITAFVIAAFPSVGVLWMVWAMAQLLAEETDEYLRFRLVRSSLFGLGTLLALATVWGFFEQFDLVPHAPAWLAVPVFALGLGVANCTRWGRM